MDHEPSSSASPFSPGLAKDSVSPPAVPGKQSAPGRDRQEKPSGERQRILVVDDDPAIANLLLEFFNLWGYDALAACNGREGMAAVEENVVDGILLDVEMPVMNGLTMLDELRWRGSRIPVILMSGGQPVANFRNLAKEGAQGFLSKPFDPNVLKETCRRVFGAPIKQQFQAVDMRVA